MATLLQIDFPSAGPWGTKAVATYADLAAGLEHDSHLRWGVWAENPQDGVAGCVFLFDDAPSASAHLAEHTRRLEALGVTGIRAVLLEVNEVLSAITHGPDTGPRLSQG